MEMSQLIFPTARAVASSRRTGEFFPIAGCNRPTTFVSLLGLRIYGVHGRSNVVT